jgi:hypothetical protein
VRQRNTPKPYHPSSAVLVIEVAHREPDAGGYRQRVEVAADGELVCAALPLPALPIGVTLDID